MKKTHMIIIAVIIGCLFLTACNKDVNTDTILQS